MRIGDSTPIVPSSAAAPAAAPAKNDPKPAMASDQFFSSDPNAVNVVTFNTAGDNCLKTPEALIPDSAVFQKVVKGSQDAPIIACQETTPVLAKKLIELSKNGNFQVVWPGHTWMPNGLPTSTLLQGNLVLIPKRYKIQHVEMHTFTGRAHQFFQAFKGWLFHHEPANNMLLALQKRGWESIQLKDSRTGKSFNVLATHVAYQDAVRRTEEPQLVKAIQEAEAKGPTVVMGDFNTPTLDTNYNHDPNVVDFWKNLEPAAVQDMGPKGQAGISNWYHGANNDIDHVLANGFESESAQMLTGDKMTIPGRPDAQQVSDHYAEADSLTFDPPPATTP